MSEETLIEEAIEKAKRDVSMREKYLKTEEELHESISIVIESLKTSLVVVGADSVAGAVLISTLSEKDKQLKWCESRIAVCKENLKQAKDGQAAIIRAMQYVCKHPKKTFDGQNGHTGEVYYTCDTCGISI